MFSRTAKRRMLAVVAVLAAVFVVAVVKTRLIGQKPFRSWEKADIAQVELTLTPADQSFALTDAEVGELAATSAEGGPLPGRQQLHRLCGTGGGL